MDELVEQVADALTAAGIAYVCDGKVLLIKRAATASAHPSTWSFPAGHIEAGETPAQAAARESMEEISHAPTDLMLVEEREGFALFWCPTAPFLPVLNDESAGYVWVTPDDLPTPLHPAVGEQVILAVAAAQAPQVDAAMDESARTIDTNGWFEVEGNPLSKVGVFPYRGRQLGKHDEPDRFFQVYRPAEELSAAECIESFRLLPWIDNHVMLGDEEKGLMPAERKGVQGVVGEQVVFDPELGAFGGLRANIKAFSQALATLIASGKRELSCGYRCRYDWTPGVTPWGEAYDCIQRRIRGNHLATVKSGRMGPDVAVLDSSDDQTTTDKEPLMAEEKDGGGSGMTLEQALETIKTAMPAITMIREAGMLTEAMLSGQAPIIIAADADAGGKKDDEAKPGEKKDDKPGETAKDDAGGTEAKKDDDKKDDKGGSAMDAAEVSRLVADGIKANTASLVRRDKLAKDLAVHVGTFDHSEMTEAEVAAYGVKKLSIKAQSGQEAAVLTGFLMAKGNPADKPVAKTQHAMDGAPRAGSAVSRFLNTEA